MKLKKSVNLEGVQPQILYAIGVCEALYAEHGYPLVVTSANDSKHGVHSLHYKGLAVDLRARNVSQIILEIIVGNIQRHLEPLGFDVVLEVDHLHVEYDPKGGELWLRISS